MKTILLTLGCCIVLAGCGSSKHVKVAQSMAEMHKPIVMTKTGNDNRPSWCTQDTSWEKDGSLYYSGGYMGGADYSLSIRLAKSEAIKNLIESVSIKAREEFSHSMHGSNMAPEDIGRYVTDSVGWTVENLQIGGIYQKGMYYEQVFHPSRMTPAYNAWVLVEIARADYVRAKVDAAQKLVQKSIKENNAEARKKAEDILQELKEEI